MADQPTEYTPTTDEIRYRVEHDWEPYGDGSFDRWLTAHDEQVRAEAKRAERKRFRATRETLESLNRNLEREVKAMRPEIAALRNMAEARALHVDVVQARAEGERAAAERIAEAIEVRLAGLSHEMTSNERKGLRDAARIARGQEVGA